MGGRLGPRPYYGESEANLDKWRLAHKLTWKQLTETVGVKNHTILHDLNSGKISPIDKHGQPRKECKAVCAYFGVDFEDLWPRYFCKIKEEEAAIQLGHKYVYILDREEKTNPESILERKQRIELILKEVLRTGSMKQMYILEKFLQDFTFTEIAELNRCTTTTTTKQFKKLIRKLRDINRIRELS